MSTPPRVTLPMPAPVTLEEMGTITCDLETLSKQVRLLRFACSGAIDDLKPYCEGRDLEYELLPLYDCLLDIQVGVDKLEAFTGLLHRRLRPHAPAMGGE